MTDWRRPAAVSAGVSLRCANLSDANLRAANLRDANLRAANLSAADLSAANLSAANLRDANLRPVRDDLWAVLCSAPGEVQGLRRALMDGKVDGSTYPGTCACLVGTLANVRGCEVRAIPGLSPNASRPAERFFLNIRPGDTPKNNQHAKIAVEFIDQFIANFQSVGAFTTEGK